VAANRYFELNKDDILAINEIIIADWQAQFVNSSLSEIFTIFINGTKENFKLADLCDKIYRFVYNHINKIIDLIGNKYSQPYTKYLTYIITSDKKHYDRVDEIYKTHKIDRYEDYARFLMVETPVVKPKPVKQQQPPSGFGIESINLSRLSISSANPIAVTLRKSITENYKEFEKMRAKYLSDIQKETKLLNETGPIGTPHSLSSVRSSRNTQNNTFKIRKSLKTHHSV